MKTIVSIFILSLIATSVFSDSDESDAQYFHPAASLYIQGDSAGASNLVVKGLSLYPDDGKLKRLKELIDQQQEEQKDQEKNQEQNNEQKNQEQNQENQNPSEPNEQQEQQPPPEQQSAEQMSEDEAKQLLDAMRQEEQNKRRQLHPVLGAPVKVDKDW